MFDIKKIRLDFPILNTTVNNQPLIYLDSGATSQKPLSVITELEKFYRYENANVHRGIHTLSDAATTRYEHVRSQLALFIGANTNEIVWTKGATESLNLIAHGIKNQLIENDVILITELEHHANIVPWQELCKHTGAVL